MNLSSVLIVAKVQHIDELKKGILKIPSCLIEFCEDKRIIVAIESESLEKELESYKMLEKLPHVISINMVFSYQDLDKDTQKAINNGAIQTIEKNENAENIRYYDSTYSQMS